MGWSIAGTPWIQLAMRLLKPGYAVDSGPFESNVVGFPLHTVTQAWCQLK